MKNGKKPTLAQKKFLQDTGLDSEKWLIVKDTPEEMVIVSKTISYKLWGLEQICSIKERKFKKGLQRRIELITNILNIMGHNYDYRDIVPKFRRNRPQNDMETAQIVTMLANDLSRETRLQLMPGVENVQDELRKLEEEKNKEQENFGVYKNFTKAFQGAADRTEAVTDEPEGT